MIKVNKQKFYQYKIFHDICTKITTTKLKNFHLNKTLIKLSKLIELKIFNSKMQYRRNINNSCVYMFYK